MGQIFSNCSRVDDNEDEERPLLDSQHPDELHPPEYIHHEEALKMAVQKACDSFIDINSTTTKLSEKLYLNDLAPPKSIVINLPVSQPTPWTENNLQVTELSSDDPEAQIVNDVMVKVQDSLSKFKVEYPGPIVVSFL